MPQVQVRQEELQVQELPSEEAQPEILAYMEHLKIEGQGAVLGAVG